MNTTTDHLATGELTRSDVTALRRATTVSFHQYQGRGYIRASLDGGYGGELRIFNAADQRLFPRAEGADRKREIDVPAGASGYGARTDGGTGWSSSSTDGWTAFHMVSSAQYDKCWTTIAGLLKAGDVLSLTWRADNSSPVIRDAGLVADDLFLRVTREERRMEFELARQVGLDNSARMIKRYGA